jgi:hypothetical protein
MAGEPTPDDAIDPALVVGLLAEQGRLRAVAALALGATSLAEVASAAGLDAPAALRALDRLVARGLVAGGPDVGYRLRTERLAATAQAAASARPVPPLDESLDGVDGVVRNFLVDGRLKGIPAARSKRLAVLDWLAGRFEPGRVYPERDVNSILRTVYDDYAALRRHLVDEEFLERRDGFYWRAGGRFDVDV